MNRSSHSAPKELSIHLAASVLLISATFAWSNHLPETLFLSGLLVLLPVATHLSRYSQSKSPDQTIERLRKKLHKTLWLCSVAAGVSTFPERGPLSGAIAACWLVWTLAAALVSATQFLKTGPRSLRRFATVITTGYLSVSAAWFTCWRVGFNPLDFPGGITLLTSVHFLYAGFLLPTVALGILPDRLNRRQQFMMFGMLTMMPVVAVGITCSPTIELAEVFLAVAVIVTLCVEQLKLAAAQNTPALARDLLSIAAVSGLSAVSLAAYYGLSEFTGNTWILIPTMIRWHGILNSVGLIGCTLGAWAAITYRPARSALQSATEEVRDRPLTDSSPSNFLAYRESYASKDSRSR